VARIRSVKPEYWTDQDLAEQVSRDARLLYIGLWNLSDEHSRLRGDPRYIKGQVFPYDDDLTPDEIEEMLDALALAGKVVRFRTASGTYLFLPKLAKNQRLEPEKVPTKLPHPDDVGAVVLTPRASIAAYEYASELDESESRADEFAQDSDTSASGEEDHALLYGTGSMEHVEVSPSSADEQPTETDNDGLFPAEEAGTPPPPPAPTPSTSPKSKWTDAHIDADPHFVAFWEAYPRKTDKGHARRAWLRRLREGVPPERLTGAAQAFREDPKRPREMRFVPHPTTWLNGERFGDYADVDFVPEAPRPWWEN
jgi:hypothetical protein